jgi:hypothetical protein
MTQLSLLDELHGLSIGAGDVVRTNYGTGPYRVVEVITGCTCPSFDEEINRPMGKARPSREHFHLVLVDADAPIGAERNEYNLRWLNGYEETPDRRFVSVWSLDELFVVVP